MTTDQREHFLHHGKPNGQVIDADGVVRCQWCQIASFKGSLSVVNTTEYERVLPPDFRFIHRTVLGKGVELADDAFTSGCSCAADHDCQFAGCQCLADLEDDVSEDEDVPSSKATKLYAYHLHGEKKGLLRSKMLESKVPIYECHRSCACSSDCPNRVVERGRTVPLQIFHTDTARGWGVRSSIPIEKGRFVDCYVGEIITPEEANRRRLTSQRKDIYLFALDKFTDRNSLDPRLQGDPLEVDGEFMSGPTRFVNHSCDPNMRIFARVGDHANKHIHDLALFAIKDIPAGDELTFDYVDGVTGEEDVPGDKSGLTVCLCGSRNCRGFLW